MKISRHTGGNFSAYGRKKISLREEINFLPYGNKFLYGRKFHGMRKKKYFHTDENRVSYGWNYSFILMEL